MKNFSKKLLLLVLAMFLVSGCTAPRQNADSDNPQNKEGELQVIDGHSDVGTDSESQQNEDSEETLAKLGPDFPIRALYLTGHSVGYAERMENIFKLVDNSEINALVMDIKDVEGIVNYRTQVPLAKEIGADSSIVKDYPAIIKRAKGRNLYLIARIVVFKDQQLAEKKPEWTVKDKNGGTWRDYKGKRWVDPYNQEIWKYNIDLAKEAVAMGFDEIQFDYVRFPSDGKKNNAVYTYNSQGWSKEENIKQFLKYASEELHALGVPISADIFGLVTTVQDDMGIGQTMASIGQYVDYISPMVYPSHYYPGNFGLANPNAHPYETVFHSLKNGQEKLNKANLSTPMRPWLQDFDLGQPSYGKDEVWAQIKACNDLGIDSWMLWNAGNKYTTEALQVTVPGAM